MAMVTIEIQSINQWQEIEWRQNISANTHRGAVRKANNYLRRNIGTADSARIMRRVTCRGEEWQLRGEK